MSSMNVIQGELFGPQVCVYLTVAGLQNTASISSTRVIASSFSAKHQVDRQEQTVVGIQVMNLNNGAPQRRLDYRS